MRSFSVKLQTLLTRLIVLVLVLFMMSIALRFLAREIMIDRLGMDNVFTRFVLWDEPAVLAPEHANAAGVSTVHVSGPVNKLKAVGRQYLTFVKRITDTVDTFAHEELMLRRPIVEAANGYEKAIGWNLAGYSEYNNVIDLGNGYLTTFMNWIDVWANVEAVLELKQYLDTQELPMLFVQLPSKVSRQDIVVNNVVDFYNNNADRLVGGLRDHGVNTLDLRENAERLNLDYRSLFYNTDHHWRAETGLWAAGVIGEELNRSFGYGIDVDLFKPENYSFKRYEKIFLGSLGKKVTLARATPDDFVLIYPRFDVNLTLTMPTIESETTGGFDILYDYSHLEQKDLYESDAYAVYLHSALTAQGLLQIGNNLPKADAHKVLMLGDSFSNVLVPFLGLEFRHIDYVDLRHYEGSLHELISSEGYDMMIIAYSEPWRVEYDSGTSLYDFR